jgi:hypothetical protein
MKMRWRLVLGFVGMFTLGYLIGPPIVRATGSIVTIQGGGSTNNAKVGSGGRLFVDTESTITSTDRQRTDSEAGLLGEDGLGYLLTFAATSPSGELVLASSSTGTSKSGEGVVTGINVDVAPTATGSVSVILLKGTQVIWRGTTKAGGGNVSYPFQNGIFSDDGFAVTVTNPSGADILYQVYGEGFGVSTIPANKPLIGQRLVPHA